MAGIDPKLKAKHDKQVKAMGISPLVEFNKRIQKGNKQSLIRWLNSLPKDTPFLDDMYRTANFL